MGWKTVSDSGTCKHLYSTGFAPILVQVSQFKKQKLRYFLLFGELVSRFEIESGSDALTIPKYNIFSGTPPLLSYIHEQQEARSGYFDRLRLHQGRDKAALLRILKERAELPAAKFPGLSHPTPVGRTLLGLFHLRVGFTFEARST